jgi:hypothetical protein
MGNLLAPAAGNVGASGQDAARAEVDRLFKARNAAFEQSKRCYECRDHAGAKHWSQQGKALDSQAKAAAQALGELSSCRLAA